MPILWGILGGACLAIFFVLLAFIFTPWKKKDIPKAPTPPSPEPEPEIDYGDDLAGPIYYEGDDDIPDLPITEID